MSSLPKLIYMANQIARNFEARGNAEAIDATAEHITKFWDPRMKKMIAEHLAAGGADLSDIARPAVAKACAPQPASS